MKREQETWKSMVIIAFAIVSIIVIAVATFRSCQRQEDKEPEPTPATEVKVSEVVETEEEIAVEPVAVECEMPERHRVGRCRLTVYNAGENSYGYATATGVRSQHLMTCAVDPTVIPYGSNVIICDSTGYEWRFKAVDCGGFSGRWVDIFFDDTERHGIEWLDEVFGGDFAEVWIEEPYCPTIEMLP